MHSIAILGFFSLVIVFFFTGRNDFGLKPTSQKIISSKQGKEIILNNVYFENNSFVLDTLSFSELDELINLLRKNHSMEIKIEGHTDNIGQDTDNLILSQNRAKSVYDYLVNHGISKARLSYKGFGARRPISTNSTKEGRAQNRRTSFVIIY